MPAADTVMLSETTDGDYLVRRFIVKRPGDTDYSVRYQINLAKLSSTLDGNSRASCNGILHTSAPTV